MWIAGYGLIIAAAATSGESYTPAVVARRVGGWIQRRRQSTRGTIALGLIALLAGLLLIQDPPGNLELIAMAAGLWLSYLGVTELLRVLRSARSATSQACGGAGSCSSVEQSPCCWSW